MNTVRPCFFALSEVMPVWNGEQRPAGFRRHIHSLFFKTELSFMVK